MQESGGRSLELVSGRYQAAVATAGGGLRQLTSDGADLVAGFPAGEPASDYRGHVLMPWPNRIEDGTYEFDGVTHQLPITEPAHHNALHGLVGSASWEVVEEGVGHVRMAAALRPQPGYPFALDLGVSYLLDADGLRVTMTATNVGPGAAPYGVGHHPYLTVGRRLDECELVLPAATWCEMSDRGLPGAPQPVAGTGYDFRASRPIGAIRIDHPFGDLTYDNGVATVLLRDPDSGRSVTMAVDDSFRWLHVFSGDTHGPRARESLAVEPMTCPPNAFNSRVDLIVLEPGDTHSLSFAIR